MALSARAPDRALQWHWRWPTVATVTALFVLGAAMGWGGQGASTLVGDLVMPVLAAAATAACVSAGRRAPQEDKGVRRGWLLVGAGMGLWLGGEVLYGVSELMLGDLTPFPSTADLYYLLGYPLIFLGLICFPMEAGLTGRLRCVLDGLMVGGSLFAVSWQLVLQPTSEQGDPWWRLSISYPVSDIALAVMAVIVARSSRPDMRRSLGLLCVGLLATGLSDGLYSGLTLSDSYSSGGLVDVGWVLGYSLIALAAETMTPESKEPSGLFRVVMSLLPYAVPLAAGYALLAGWFHGRRLDAVPLSILVALGFALLIRQVMSLLEHHRLTRVLADRDALFRSLVEGSSDVVAIIDELGVIRFHSPASERVLGYPAESMLGLAIVDLIHPEDRPSVVSSFRKALEADGLDRGRVLVECRLRDAGGEWRYVEVFMSDQRAIPAIRGFVVNARDITERHDLQRHLSVLAFQDPLTGLSNRTLFMDRLERALATRTGRLLTVLYIDLDGFKAINDSLGHAAGDALLIEATERLKDALRLEDTVARLGGDEFAAILIDVGTAQAARVVAERIVESLANPISVAGREVVVTASVGIAVSYPGATAEELLRNADLAMYGAKASGKSAAEVFEPSMHVAVLDRLELEGDLRRALAEDAFQLVYQPVVDLRTGKMASVEALLRWNHPTRGAVSPSEFVPVAEETGLIVPLGRWALEQATYQVARWRGRGFDLNLSVNVSVRQVKGPGLLDTVRSALRRSGLPASALTLEITESVLVDADRIVGRLETLRELGVRLAIDDFGTGFSSLGYLRLLPVQQVKIDQSFTAGLGAERGLTAVTTTIVRLGQDLGMTLVAEGIEQRSQLEHLQEVGCHLGQGYLFAPPLDVAGIDELLAEPERLARITHGAPEAAAPA